MLLTRWPPDTGVLSSSAVPVSKPSGSRQRQSDVKHRTTFGLVLCPYPAVMRFDDSSGNGQADSHALWLCREKRLKNFLDLVRGNAWTSVRYRNLGEIVGAAGTDGHTALASRRL